MKPTCVVIDLYAEPRWLQRLANNLAEFKGLRKLGYVKWLNSINIEVEYKE